MIDRIPDLFISRIDIYLSRALGILDEGTACNKNLRISR
jgi:hypothetical protein